MNCILQFGGKCKFVLGLLFLHIKKLYFTAAKHEIKILKNLHIPTAFVIFTQNI